jgi:ribulose-5-phosphate 4-epimerase/fuculose-1-phosphate aldolase
MLIRTPELGAALSRALGTAPVALMRGHGDVVVAPSLKEAVFRAVYTEVNVRLEAEALRLAPLGRVTFQNDEEGEGHLDQCRRSGPCVGLWKAKALAATR